MPNTGPVNYYWVGGSTGSTSASRFDWNVTSNWRVKISEFDKASEYNLKIPTLWPAGGDSVRLGYGSEFTPGATSSHGINSPLLFGGWSGSGNTGCWICAGETGSGLSGASGTTFGVNLLILTVDNYPFAGIGGGLTGSQVSGYPSTWLLTSMGVAGMNEAAWIALGNAATDRQKTLKLKVNNVTYDTVSKQKASGVYTPQAWFAPVIVDTWNSYGVSGGAYITSVINFTGISDADKWTYPRLVLNDSKVLEINKSHRMSLENGSGVTAEALDIILDNCTVGYINTVPAGHIQTKSNCIIGKLGVNTQNFDDMENNQSFRSALGGTFKHYTALAALGYPGATLPADDAEVNLAINPKSNYYSYISFGETAGVTGTFVANRVIVNNGSTLSAANTRVVFNTKSSIGEMSVNNAKLVAGYLLDNLNPIEITTLRLRDNSLVDFRANTQFDNWRFGLATASASGLTLNGGLIFESGSASILGDPGIRFINYGKSATIDIRNSKPLGTSDIAVPPAEAL